MSTTLVNPLVYYFINSKFRRYFYRFRIFKYACCITIFIIQDHLLFPPKSY